MEPRQKIGVEKCDRHVKSRIVSLLYFTVHTLARALGYRQTIVALLTVAGASSEQACRTLSSNFPRKYTLMLLAYITNRNKPYQVHGYWLRDYKPAKRLSSTPLPYPWLIGYSTRAFHYSISGCSVSVFCTRAYMIAVHSTGIPF
jgi:hypothetical protein